MSTLIGAGTTVRDRAEPAGSGKFVLAELRLADIVPSESSHNGRSDEVLHPASAVDIFSIPRKSTLSGVSKTQDDEPRRGSGH